MTKKKQPKKMSATVEEGAVAFLKAFNESLKNSPVEAGSNGTLQD